MKHLAAHLQQVRDGDLPASRSGTLLIVRMLWVTSSPTRAVAARRRDFEEALAVGQADGEPVELRFAGIVDLALGLQPLPDAPVERNDILARKGIVERKHRHAMPDLREGGDGRAADALGRRIGNDEGGIVGLELTRSSARSRSYSASDISGSSRTW